MKPPFTYFGGKLSIADRIVSLLPAHKHYVEPFAGSLAVLLAKPPSPVETVNDLSRDLMTFWRVLRDRPAELERVCTLTPCSRAEYEDAYTDADGELEQARRVWVRITQGRGDTLSDEGWRYILTGRRDISPVTYQSAFVRRMASAAARLRMVHLECRPALEVIATYGKHPDALIYADPPYLAETRTPRSAYGRYELEMRDEADHRDLAASLAACKATVVLSGYASPLHDELYAGWHRREVPVSSGNATDRRRVEVLWSNRPFPQGSLFDHLEDAG